MQNNQKVLMLGGGTSNSLLLRLMASSTLVPVDLLSEFAVNDVEAALALSFITNEYRTGNSETTFAEAFTGTSPKLTYSTAAGSNSTMVNSAGEIVWAPHNLFNYSDGSQAQLLGHNTTDAATPIEGFSNSLYFNGDGAISIKYFSGIPSGVLLTLSIYVELDNGEEPTFPSQPGALFAFVVGGVSPSYGSGYTVTNVGGNVYQVSATLISGSSGDAGIIQHTNQTTPFKATGWQCYRSDLGGMHPVPGAVGDFQYYVPTNGNAEYLPRVGHHVYNGSTWVNEGLLIESEPRTNLVTHSDFSSGWSEVRSSIDPNVTTEDAPDGTNNVTAIKSDLTASNSHRAVLIVANPLSSENAFTFSSFVKYNGTNVQFEVTVDPASTVQLRKLNVLFDLQAGTAATPFASGSPNVIDYGIENVGGGWYRCHVTTDNPDGTRVDVALALSQSPASNPNATFDGDGASGVFVYGAQFEVGEAIPNTNPVQYKDAPTPSSYMPTSGGTYTRTAQSLEVPPAEFGWPEPEYIGQELVTNGTFDSDVSGWTDGSSGTGSISFDAGTLLGTSASISDLGIADQSVTTVVGKRYILEVEITATTGALNGIRAGTSQGGSQLAFINSLGVGVHTLNFTATGTTTWISLRSYYGSGTTNWDNISVREINPLAVSIQMDGRMTYADEDEFNTVLPYLWRLDDPNKIDVAISTYSTDTGGAYFRQSESGVYDEVNSNNTYTLGVLVPFNIASRHGSTFVNGAVDGVALTEDTTPTVLPDLSGTDLQIAYDYMGTIGTFRQFAGDIGDDGLEEATS